MISARALGVLLEASTGEVNLSAESISKRFTEGRDAIRAALEELRNAGFVQTRRERINGRWVTFSQVTEAGFRCLKTRLLIPMELQNSNNTVILHSLKNITNPPTESAGENMPYEFFEKNSSMDDDERLAERRRARDAQKAAYAEARAKTANKRFTHRQSIPKADWTCTDVAFEFADRVQEHWHIKPWAVTKSRFVQALGTARKQHDTNGEMEFEAINRFFDSISINQYDDAEVLWKMFIKRFPMFIGQIRNVALPDEEVSDDDLIRSAKTIERFRKNVQG